MRSVLRFAVAAIVFGAVSWLLHQVLWPDDQRSWGAALAWGAWMAAFGMWSERRRRAGKSMDSPALSVASGLALTGIGIACLFQPPEPSGSGFFVSGAVMTCLGLVCLGSGVRAMRQRNSRASEYAVSRDGPLDRP